MNHVLHKKADFHFENKKNIKGFSKPCEYKQIHFLLLL